MARRTLTLTAAAAVLVALFAALGLWQLERAGEKRARHREHLARLEMAPVTLRPPALPAAAEVLGRRVEARGCFDDRHALLDNRMHRGRPGYEIVTPFALECRGPRVLVNRGWRPAAADRDVVEQPPTPAGAVRIAGVARPAPGETFTLGEPYLERPAPGLLRVQVVDPDQVGAALGLELPGFLVQLDASAPGGFVREWPRPGSGAARHRAYAVQWLAIGIVTIVVYAALLRRREPGA